MRIQTNDIILVMVTLKLTSANGTWTPEFKSASRHLTNPAGDFNFQKTQRATVVITVENSGIVFLPNADDCIGFDKKKCPTAVEKDKEVFKDIAVSEDGKSLSFLNLNKKQDFYYALFLRDAAGGLIPLDPRIINK